VEEPGTARPGLFPLGTILALPRFRNIPGQIHVHLFESLAPAPFARLGSQFFSKTIAEVGLKGRKERVLLLLNDYCQLGHKEPRRVGSR